jgi:transposase
LAVSPLAVSRNQRNSKELLRAVYAASDLAQARAALARFYRWSDGVGVAELSRLARTVRAWEAEILGFHSTQGCSNGPPRP